jgi:hypothetical protein
LTHGGLFAATRAAARRFRAGLGLAVVLWLSVTSASASSLRYCDEPAALSAAQKDRLFRFAAVIKAELDASGRSVALVSRSGLDLSRFGVRYSHAGVGLQTGLDTPWAVRQLYYACDERRPRVFDQGVAGFLLGLNDPGAGYVSVVLLPEDAAATLRDTVLDGRQALRVLGSTYSANAYPFSLSYQNCNQWVMEMLAQAWGALDHSDGPDARARAQEWLRAQGYRPTTFDVGWRPLMWVTHFVPWLRQDDHPADDLAGLLFRVSMPGSIETFVRDTVPAATRLEFCQADTRVVIHRGWDPIAEGCVPGEHDTVVMLD